MFSKIFYSLYFFCRETEAEKKNRFQQESCSNHRWCSGHSVSIQLSKYRASYYSGHGATGNIYTAFGSLTRKGIQVHRVPALKLKALIWSIACCAHTSLIGKPQISGPVLYEGFLPLLNFSTFQSRTHACGGIQL